jgi:hypothetical protein
MDYKTSARGLGLNIRGLDVRSGILSTMPLRVQAENATYIPHKNNTDFTISSPALINYTPSGIANIILNDFSSNKYDSFFSSNQGKNSNQYELECSWYINDIDIEDDIAIVGTRDWTSTEKYTTVKYYPTVVSTDVISNVDIQKTVDTEEGSVTCNIYNWSVNWATASLTYGSGYVIVNSFNCDGTQTTTTTYLAPASMGTLTTKSTSKPSYSLNGSWTNDPLDPADFVNTGLFSSETVITSCPIDTYRYTEGGFRHRKYCLKNTFSHYTPNADYPDIDVFTYFNIKNLNSIFQKPKYLTRPADKNVEGGTLNSNTPLGKYPTYPKEFPDYSDIFIQVDYVKSTGGLSTLTDSIILTSGMDTRYIYTFGGFLSYSDYTLKCSTLSRSNYNTKPRDLIADDEGYKWYMVYRDTSGDYEFLTLSSYIIPSSILTSSELTTNFSKVPLVDNRFHKIFNPSVDIGNALDPSTGGTYLIQNSIISADSIKVIKVANYGNCGKVDIYTKKNGDILSISGNYITSSGHGLNTGDSIKITSALNSTSGLTPFNGIRYVSGVSADKFAIYLDQNFKTPISGTVRSTSGILWSALDKTNWKYNGTLYSPQGKNGYGFSSKLRLVSETGVESSNIVDRAIESSPTDDSFVKPQAHLNSWISWTNFYPFERAASSEASITLENGNKFGADCQISKVSDNNYVLMVTEPGAEVSFKICDDFIISSQNISPGQSTEPLPNNQFVIPNFLPQGRVHFYKITKSPYSIEYMTSVAATGNPWAAYETLNQNYKSQSNIASYTNYPISAEKVKNNYSVTYDNYWIGARYYSWKNSNYIFNSSYAIEGPDQTNNITRFGFVDSFGKAAAFDIDHSNNQLHCVTTTNVKNFDNTRLPYTDCLAQAFNINLTTTGISTLSGIVNQSDFYSPIAKDQYNEIYKYGSNVDFDDSRLIIGWPAERRSLEYLYIYDRIGSGYEPIQTITSAGNNNFGEYFVADNDFLVTNRYSDIDDSGNVTDPLNYVYVYERDARTNRYLYMQRISPTIDLTKDQYQSLTSEAYILTANLSYDNTTNDSATLTSDLYGRYDIYDNSLVIRDYNEHAYFVYNSNDNKFICTNHNLLSDTELLTTFGVLRMRPSSSSLADGSTGEFINSLEVMEGTQFLSTARIITRSYQNPNYLPLFVKTTDGYSSGQVDLFTHGKLTYDPQPTGLTLFIQSPQPFTGGMNLFAKQYDEYESGVNLFLKAVEPYNTGFLLFIKSNFNEVELPLVMNPNFTQYFPLYMKTYAAQTLEFDEDGNPTGNTIEIELDQIGYSTNSFDLMIKNYHTGVPNGWNNMNLNMITYPYMDFGRNLNLTIGKQLPTSNSNLQIFLCNPSGTTPNSSGGSFSISNLYLQGPDRVNGVDYSNTINLFMKRIMDVEMPLFVYNTYVSGGLDNYIRGGIPFTGGTSLYVSGEPFPINASDSGTLYIAGTVL